MNEQMFKDVKVFNTDFFEEGKAYFISHIEGLEIDGLLLQAHTYTLTFIVIDTDEIRRFLRYMIEKALQG